MNHVKMPWRTFLALLAAYLVFVVGYIGWGLYQTRDHCSSDGFWVQEGKPVYDDAGRPIKCVRLPTGW